MELVKAELEQAQQENTKLKQTQVDPEKRGAPRSFLCCMRPLPLRLTAFTLLAPGLGSSPVVGDLAVEGSLETHYLVEQVCRVPVRRVILLVADIILLILVSAD